MAVTWPAERLILERVATLGELESVYSIDDVMQRNLALDAKQLAEQDAQKR